MWILLQLPGGSTLQYMRHTFLHSEDSRSEGLDHNPEIVRKAVKAYSSSAEVRAEKKACVSKRGR